jgi:hypothetical protein
MKPDGTGRSKLIQDRVIEVAAVTPDGRWVIVGVPNPDEERPAIVKAIALDGSARAPVPICVLACWLHWDLTGKFVFLDSPDLGRGSYVIPVIQDGVLPKIPSAPIRRIEDIPNAKKIPWDVGSALNPSVYAYTRETTRKNLYRIPLP